MTVRPLILGIFAVFLPLSQAVANDVAYKWVDENGVTNFSDKPPATVNSVQGSVEHIALPGDFAVPTDPAEDYYSISNQWKRLNEERIAREKVALERERIRIERTRAELAEKAAATPYYEDTARYVVYGGVPGFVYPRPFFTGHHPFHDKHPDFFHGSSRHGFKPHLQKTPRKVGGELDRLPGRRVTFKCC